MNVLKMFEIDFKSITGIKVYDAKIGTGNWCRLELDQLNCDELEKIANFIRLRFTKEGQYRHHLPKIGRGDYGLALIIGEELLKQIYK